jgi:hypothetical protein
VGCGGRFARPAQGGDAFEVVGTETLHRPGPCPHSNLEAYPALVVYEVSRDGRVRRTAQDVSPWPQPKVSARTAPCVGRDTEGSGRVYVDARSLGDHLAQLAHDESVSIASFDRLARELASAGAPRGLLGRARRAARDERRHAKTMARLAEAHGGSVRWGSMRSLPPRPLAAWTLENAIEGCVGETYSALVAAYQARHAPDERTRRGLARIARDEAEHARLAWDVHAWALSAGGAELAPVRLARADQLGRRRLRDSATTAPPRPSIASALLDAETGVVLHPQPPASNLSCAGTSGASHVRGFDAFEVVP